MAAIKPNEKASGGDNEAAKDAAFRGRLGLLVKEHSVRGLARKLGIPNQSIGNYLKKSQPPLSFGRKLVEKLGVNPAWVLTGEGSPMLSDVAEATSATAADLMELVKAMGDVTRMKLGALSGKKHAQALRELNDAMVRYEELRAKLNAYSKPVMEKLIEDLSALLDEPGVQVSDQLHSLIKAAEQIGRLCEDPRLHSAYKRQRARYLRRLTDFEGASRLIRDVVAYDMLSSREPAPEGIADIQRLVGFLQNQYRLREAQQIAEAGLIFVQSDNVESQSYLQLMESAAMIDVTRGNLVRARERVLHVLPRVDEQWRQRSTMPLLAIVHFYAGAMRYSEVYPFCRGLDAPFFLANVALWAEKREELEHYRSVLEKFESALPLRSMLLAETTALLRAKEGAGTLEAFDRSFPRPDDKQMAAAVSHFMGHPISRCQIAIAAGQKKQAIEAVIDADKAFERAKPQVELPIGSAARHYRNVLRVSANGRSKQLAAARARALDFFHTHVKAGYAVFRPVLEETVTE